MCECLLDLDLAHGGPQGLQSLLGVAHEVWKSVDRLWKLQERFRAEFINAFRPRGDRCRRDQESLGCLFGDQPCTARRSRIALRLVGA